MITRSLVAVLGLLAVVSCSAPAARNEPAAAPAAASATPAISAPPEIAAILRDIKARDTGQLAVSEEDGRFLRLLVATNGAKQALEIGAASGYSAIWIGLGLRDTGGRLVTIEYDATRAKEAAANIQRAGLSDIVRVVSGDAFAEIPKVAGGFDFVFLDAWKKDYKRFFDVVYPRLQKRGLFVAHNVLNKRNEMEDFIAAIERHPSLWTTTVAPSGEGMSVSVRRN
jgi:caffeoyl-CoA O-methyltransferase